MNGKLYSVTLRQVAISLLLLLSATLPAHSQNLSQISKPFELLLRVNGVDPNSIRVTPDTTLPLNSPVLFEDSWAGVRQSVADVVAAHLKRHPKCEPFSRYNKALIFMTAAQVANFGNTGPFAIVLNGSIYINLDRPLPTKYDNMLLWMHEYTHVLNYCGPDTKLRPAAWRLVCVIGGEQVFSSDGLTQEIANHFQEELREYKKRGKNGKQKRNGS